MWGVVEGDVDAEIDVDVFFADINVDDNFDFDDFSDIQIILLPHWERYHFHDFLNFAWKSDFPNWQNDTNQLIS